MRRTVTVFALLAVLSGSAFAQVDDGAVRAIFAAGATAPVQYQANERDLANASYTVKDGRGEGSALLNWTNGLMKFTGIAMSEDLLDEEGLRMEARDFAYVKAREFLEGIIVGREATYEDKGIRLVGGGEVSEKQGRQTTQRSGISVPPSLVRTGPVIELPITYLPHPTKVGVRIARAEAVVALLLYNREHPDRSLVSNMLPDLKARLATMEVVAPPPLAAGTVADLRAGEPAIDQCTGLIIDTRGHRMRPVASPEVYIAGQADRLVYGALQVGPEHVATIGVAGWSKSTEQAQALERVGKHPLVIAAEGSLGPDSGAVVISAKDADRVMAADQAHPFLRECRVAFVID